MAVGHLGIAVNLHPFKSIELNPSGIINPSLNLARRLSCLTTRQIPILHCRDFNVNIDSVHQRAGDLRPVALNLRDGTGALIGEIRIVPAGATMRDTSHTRSADFWPVPARPAPAYVFSKPLDWLDLTHLPQESQHFRRVYPKMADGKGISQVELAERIGVNEMTIVNWEIRGMVPANKHLRERLIQEVDGVGELLDIHARLPRASEVVYGVAGDCP